MLKSVSTALIAMSVIMVSTAFADDKPCSKARTAGSYIRLRDDPTPTFIEQVVLHSDGTAYFYQSTSLDHPITNGTSTSEIGSWKCVDADTLVMTVIGENYRSEPITSPDDPLLTLRDTAPDSRDRLTLRFDVQDKDTLVRNYFIDWNFDLSANPLDPNAVPLYDPVIGTNTPVYQRVPVLTSDLP